MRHSIWFLHAGLGDRTPTGHRSDSHAEPRPVRASTRLWARSLLAFFAALLLFASMIEIVAAIAGDGRSWIFAAVGIPVAFVVSLVLLCTRS